MKKILRITAVMVMLAALSLVFTTSSALAIDDEVWEEVELEGWEHSTMTWDLDSESMDTVIWEMERTGGPGDDGQESYVQIAPGETHVWISDEAASGPVVFDSADWAVVLTVCDDDPEGLGDPVTPGNNVNVTIGVWDGTDFTAKSVTESVTLDTSKVTPDDYNYIKVTIMGLGAFTVPDGQHLALEVESTEASDTVTICAGGCSGLLYPCDSEWPVPEIATIALIGGGLLLLGGVIVWKRRKASSTT